MAEVRMSQQELADVLEIGVSTVVEWSKRGMPARKRGGRWYFDVELVRDWVSKYTRASKSADTTTAGRAEADLRKAVALAELRELELRKRRGELVDRDAMRETVGALAATLRTRGMGLPGRMALVLEGKSRAEIESTLRGEILALLQLVAGAPFTGAEDALCTRCRAGRSAA